MSTPTQEKTEKERGRLCQCRFDLVLVVAEPFEGRFSRLHPLNLISCNRSLQLSSRNQARINAFALAKLSFNFLDLLIETYFHVALRPILRSLR